MDRRFFLKSLAFLSITPFIPSIPFNPGSIEVSALSWDEYNSDPIADINAAIEFMRKETGYRPNKMIMSERVAEELGYDVKNLPLDVEVLV